MVNIIFREDSYRTIHLLLYSQPFLAALANRGSMYPDQGIPYYIFNV